MKRDCTRLNKALDDIDGARHGLMPMDERITELRRRLMLAVDECDALVPPKPRST